MDSDKVTRMIFAVGLVVLGGIALFLNKDAMGAVCIGAVAGVFTMGKGQQPTQQAIPFSIDDVAHMAAFKVAVGAAAQTINQKGAGNGPQ